MRALETALAPPAQGPERKRLAAVKAARSLSQDDARYADGFLTKLAAYLVHLETSGLRADIVSLYSYGEHPMRRAGRAPSYAACTRLHVGYPIFPQPWRGVGAPRERRPSEPNQTGARRPRSRPL